MPGITPLFAVSGISGDPSPSSADISVTRRPTREAAQAIDIEFLDHLIVGEKTADPAAKVFTYIARPDSL